MARKRSTASAPKESTAPAAGPGHNLSPDQRHALVLLHRRRFKEIDAREKLVKAEKRNLGKVIKADLGEHGMDQVKTLIRMETPEGEAAVQAEIQAKREAAAWAVGENGQLDMFTDKKPAGDTKAFLDGKLAGMDDEPRRNPYREDTADGEDWFRGFDRGAEVLKELREIRPETPDKEPPTELIEGPAREQGQGNPNPFDGDAP